MFTLQDGREHLYQWDLDRYLIVEDNTIDEVHFCNRTSDCSLVVEVKDGLAAIPNIILQDARPIRAYAYVDDKYTLVEQQFTVKSRTRPADYIYTETEVKRWEDISAKAETAVNEAEAAASAATEAVNSVNQAIEEFQEQLDSLVETETYYFRLYDASKGYGEAPVEVAQFATDITRADYNANNIKKTVHIEYDYMPVTDNVQVEYGDPNWLSIGASNFDTDGTLKSFAVFCYPRDKVVSDVLHDRQLYINFTKDRTSSTGWKYTASLTTTKLTTEQYVKNAVANVSVDTSKFLTKAVDSPSAYNWYVTGSNSAQTIQTYTPLERTEYALDHEQGFNENTIPVRVGQQLRVPTTPTSDNHAASKAYVDSAVANIGSGISAEEVQAMIDASLGVIENGSY
jgi:hypothetical protein